MSNLNFLHSGGNKVTLSSPDSNPSSNVTFKLPQSDGSAGQVLQTDGSGALSFSNSGLVLIEHKEFGSGSTSTTNFHFNNCFSSTFKDYVAYFNIVMINFY